MINVLFVYGDILRRGGIESCMMNYYRYISHDKIHIDFALQGYEEGVYDDEILAGGSCIYRLEKPGKHLATYKRQLTELLSTGKYQIVHAHCDAMNCRIMRLAKACGVPVRIAHSHNTHHIVISWLKHLFYEYCRKRVARYATECWACSEAAGKWLFGGNRYRVIPNAVEIERFAFDEKKRADIREEYGISEDEIVLGHVGRFDYQKNHDFLIDLLQVLAKNGRRRYRLLLVGEGLLCGAVRDKADRLGLGEQVIFTGGVSDPERYYNAMDLFLIPSLFEGYPLVVSEAEANGLYCIASEYISDEVNKMEMVDRLPLDLALWRQRIEEADCRRNINASEYLKECGFDINDAAQKVENEYIRLCGEHVKADVGLRMIS